MAFNGDEGKMIDAATAQKWIDNYQTKVNDPNATKSVFFGFRRLSELFGEDGSMGIRVFFAIDDEGAQTVVLASCNAKQQTMAKLDGSSLSGLVLDFGIKCPPSCQEG